MNSDQITLVDSNVLLDILTGDPTWGGWSAETLSRAFDTGDVVINPVVYAEVSVGFDRIEDLDDALPQSMLRREALPYSAGFLAGKAFLAYRRRGGARPTPLPDFLRRRTRGSQWISTPDPRREAVPDLLPTPRNRSTALTPVSPGDVDLR